MPFLLATSKIVLMRILSKAQFDEHLKTEVTLGDVRVDEYMVINVM